MIMIIIILIITIIIIYIIIIITNIYAGNLPELLDADRQPEHTAGARREGGWSEGERG
jgi:hypothetical protein